MHRVLSFGELLLRFETYTNPKEFEGPTDLFKMYPGGSEANVAVTLAALNIPVSYFTVVPDHGMAKDVLEELKNRGIDTSRVLLEGDRIGLYFLQGSNGLTTGNVVYDRKFSSFYNMDESSIDWDQLFEGHTWFHWTAITPALSERWMCLMKKVLEEARKRSLFISVDLNYRSRLWDFGIAPRQVMPELVSFCDLIMGNIWASHIMLGTPIQEDFNRNTSKQEYHTFAEKISQELFHQFPQCNHIAHTFRFMDDPKHNLLYGTYHTRDGSWISGTHETKELIDRIGSGDAFMGGLIAGLCKGYGSQEIIESATASGFRKLFVAGDFHE
ncbi:carbohydrate kinase [Chryseobacterium piperi]|uniref:Carbohydrate kinase n=1 Tax=Chryseobacterium piperi TaxID=558152 RepID=A0A086B9P3_9FLAO|nr:sugar kinase [Chryseobacterium piperi]KFF25657.1 carbohydrate kinase [Chryseobacterium piperi]